MNDKRQSSDNDDDNFLGRGQSHFRLLSIRTNNHIYTPYLTLLHILLHWKHFSKHYFTFISVVSIFSIPWDSLSGGVQFQWWKMTQDMTEERQRLAAISSLLMRHIYLSLYLSLSTPAPARAIRCRDSGFS